jgi:hypothetical protein
MYDVAAGVAVPMPVAHGDSPAEAGSGSHEAFASHCRMKAIKVA